jgi:hypothetical protein
MFYTINTAIRFKAFSFHCTQKCRTPRKYESKELTKVIASLMMYIWLLCIAVLNYQHSPDNFIMKLIVSTRLEVFTAMKIHVKFFWVVTLCSVVVGYQCFRGPCCLHLQGEVTGSGKTRHRYRPGYLTTTLHGITTQKNSTRFCIVYVSSFHGIKRCWTFGFYCQS